MAPSAPLGGPQQAASARDERPALTPWPPGSLCTTWRRRRRCTATASRPTPSSSRRPRRPRAAFTPSTGAPPPGAAPGCGSPCASPHAQAYQGPGWPALPEQALSSVCLCTVPVTVWPRCRAQSLLTVRMRTEQAKGMRRVKQLSRSLKRRTLQAHPFQTCAGNAGLCTARRTRCSTRGCRLLRRFARMRSRCQLACPGAQAGPGAAGHGERGHDGAVRERAAGQPGARARARAPQQPAGR